jgi:hypothetical protein
MAKTTIIREAGAIMNYLSSGISLFLAVIIFGASNVEADARLSLEPKFGLNFATLSGDSDAGIIVGGIAGGALTVQLSENLAFRTELLFSMKGSDWERDWVEGDTTGTISQWVRINYVELPVLVEYSLPKYGRLRPYLYAGPAFAYNVVSEAKVKNVAHSQGQKVMHESKYYNSVYNVKSTQFEIVLGGGFDISLGAKSLAIEGRYTLGLGKAFEDLSISDVIPENEIPIIGSLSGEGADFKHQVFSVTLAMSFGL